LNYFYILYLYYYYYYYITIIILERDGRVKEERGSKRNGRERENAGTPFQTKVEKNISNF